MLIHNDFPSHYASDKLSPYNHLLGIGLFTIRFHRMHNFFHRPVCSQIFCYTKMYWCCLHYACLKYTSQICIVAYKIPTPHYIICCLKVTFSLYSEERSCTSQLSTCIASWSYEYLLGKPFYDITLIRFLACFVYI
jgi:hypothetical protein